jgi:hypothetical protein
MTLERAGFEKTGARRRGQTGHAAGAEFMEESS